MSPVPAARTSKRAAVSTAVASPESKRDLRPIRSGIEIEPWSEDGEATLVRGPTGPRTAAAGFSVLYRGGVRARRHPLGLESPACVAAHGAHELFRNRAIGSRRGIGRRLDRQNERRKGNARQPDGSQSIPLRRGPQEPRDDQKQCRRHPDDIGKVSSESARNPRSRSSERSSAIRWEEASSAPTRARIDWGTTRMAPGPSESPAPPGTPVPSGRSAARTLQSSTAGPSARCPLESSTATLRTRRIVPRVRCRRTSSAPIEFGMIREP